MPQRLSATENALIHAPVALFALPAAVIFPVALALRGAPRLVLLGLCWWCVSAAVMMVVDGSSRRARYERLVGLLQSRGSSPPGIRQTICGLFMSWALRYRQRAGCRESIPKGVDA